MIETALHNLLIADASITAIMGSRVYVGSLPQSVSYPNICIIEISPNPMFGTRCGFPHYQLSCRAESYDAAYALADAVVNVLQGYRGTQSGYGIEHIEYITRNGIYDEKARKWHVPVEVKVKFKKDEV